MQILPSNINDILADIETSRLIALAQQSNQSFIDLAKKLVSNLLSKNITSDKPNANLYLQDLLSSGKADLSALLTFLSTNGIRFANLKLAIPFGSNFEGAQGKGAEFAGLTAQQKALYVAYPNNENPQFNVYKDGLLEYINSLKEQAKSNPLFAAILDKIIQQIKAFGISASTVKEDKAKSANQPPAPNQSQVDPKFVSNITDRQQIAVVIREIQEIFPSGFDGPFDLTTQQIEINRFEGFLDNFSKVLAIPQIQQEFKYNLNAIRSAIMNISSLVSQWKTTAAPAAREGFEFNINAPNRATLFVETYANANYGSAIQMATSMMRICNALVALVRQILASPTLTEFVSKEAIDAQYKTGLNYATYLQDTIGVIRNMMQRAR